MEGLILHRGAGKATREDLAGIETPAATASWRPVPHFEAATLIAETAGRCGYTIRGEEYGVTPNGRKMFGVLKFAQEGIPGLTRALGMRNSHDKTLALSITVGSVVCVCDNLLFAGSGMTIHRKHTSGIEIGELIPGAFERLAEEYEKLEENIARMRTEHVDGDEARLEAVKAAEARAIPSSDILAVLKEFQSPRHEEFREPTRWSLYNSFTETAKKYSPARADLCYRRLARIFGLE